MVATLLKVILIFSASYVALAAFAIGPAKIHPNHPGKCWIEGQAVEVGGFLSSKEGCEGFYCEDHQRSTCPHGCQPIEPNLLQTYYSCPLAAAPPPCVMVADDSAPYPECCPKPVCN